MGSWLKRAAGRSADIFLQHKADWLVRNFAPLGRVLDFGCGTGLFLRALRQSAAAADLTGCDVSAGMIEAARKCWDTGPLPPLVVLQSGELPFADGTFDMVTATCVFHHVEASARASAAAELLRVTKPGGVLVVFEHNPLNPLTRWLVSRYPVDANAVLLSADESERLLGGGGAADCRTEYILFFPPRFRALWPLERFLSRVPLGGQYATVARKPA